MSTIVTRAAKGSPLTHAEVDANFTNLNTDKYQSGDSVTFTTLTANSTSEFGRSSANYWQAVGAATTLTPQFVTLGSDTNIPVTFRSKGTGAVNLAPGSSGVNISNGGTVTAITRTAFGSNYTSIPSVTVSAPTTAGGVTATASARMGTNATPTVVSGGTGYTLNDILTVSGGTSTNAVQLNVTGVSGGVITAVTIRTEGVYSVLPTNPVSVTGGTGSGATFNLGVWYLSSVVVDTAGSGYVEQPTVTFSGGGGSGAAAYATVGSGTTVRSVGSTISFNTPGGEGFRINDTGASIVNYVQVNGDSSSGNTPGIQSQGASSVLNLRLSSKSSGSLIFATNSNTNSQLRVAHTGSAVNYVQVTGASTGNRVRITAEGSDSNVGINYLTKGAERHNFLTNGNIQFSIFNTNSAVNRIDVTGAITGDSPKFEAVGTDTNIDLALTPKGTGLVRFGTRTATSDVAITGYLEIKDSGGTTRKLAIID